MVTSASFSRVVLHDDADLMDIPVNGVKDDTDVFEPGVGIGTSEMKRVLTLGEHDS